MLQNVLLRSEAEERPADQGQFREIEGPANLVVDPPMQLGFPLILRETFQVEHGERSGSGSGLMDLLDGSRLDRRKGGPIDLVSPHDFIEAPAQRVRVDPSVKAKRRLKVIGAVVWPEALQEPDVLLRESERDLSG